MSCLLRCPYFRGVLNEGFHCIQRTTPFHSSELALPWDPLASSYHLMATVQRALVSLQCPLEPEDTGTGQSVDTTESFPKDGIVNTLGMLVKSECTLWANVVYMGS